METYDLLGYLGAFLIGAVLGLIGSGGSILTVPVLVYLIGSNPIIATAYSLFVVGVTSLVGSIRNVKKDLVDFKTAFVFALPAFIAVYATRRFIIPIIPDELFTIYGFIVTKDVAIMVFFAILMVVASLSMIFKKTTYPSSDTIIVYNYPLILLEGLIVGILTGLVGAGGGFLIIPALVLLAKLPMKKAVATSLVIIAIKSLIGFIGDVENLDIDWQFLLLFTLISILGIGVGLKLNNYIDGDKLKKGFGVFVLLMGIVIITKELFL